MTIEEKKAKKKEYNKLYNERNREYIRKQQMEHYFENREARLKYNEDNKVHRNEQKKDHYRRNKDSIIKRITKYKQNKKATDPVYALLDRNRKRINRACKDQGFIKCDKTIPLLGCTKEEFEVYFKSLFTDGMTWEMFLDGEITIDHIIPLTFFSLQYEDEQKKAFHYLNTQPMLASDNYFKKDNLDMSFYNLISFEPLTDTGIQAKNNWQEKWK